MAMLNKKNGKRDLHIKVIFVCISCYRKFDFNTEKLTFKQLLKDNKSQKKSVIGLFYNCESYDESIHGSI